MFKALTIVLAFLAFAYECEGALFFYHVPKSEVSNSNVFYSTVGNENILCLKGIKECSNSKQGFIMGRDVYFVRKTFDHKVLKT